MAENYNPNGSRPLEEKTAKPTAKKVVRGTVTVRKKNGAERIRDVLHDVGGYVMETIIKPMGKRMFYEAITGGLSHTLFGEQRNEMGGGNRYWRPGGQAGGNYPPPQAAPVRRNRSWRDEIVACRNREDALEVWKACIDWMNAYGQLPLARFFDFNGQTCDYTYENYGWRSLPETIPLGVTYDGQYYLNMPDVVMLGN